MDIFIIPTYASLILRGISIVNLVSKDGFVAQNQKAMCETAWNKELIFVLIRKLNHDIFAKGRAALANIHSDIKHFSLDDTDEFCL